VPIAVLSRLQIPEAAAAGRVLAADAQGVGTWQPAGSGFTPASLTADSAAIAATETAVISATVPANLLKAGSTFRVRAAGVMTIGVTAGTVTARARLGTTGALTDPVVAVHTPIPIASKTNIPFLVEFNITCRTAGAAGTVIGGGTIDGSAIGTTGTAAGQTATAAVNTTVANVLQLTLQFAAGNSITAKVATIELVVP
jgi:hypothetical protein